MSTNNSNTNALTMLVGAVAGIVTVASSSGQHDLSDTAIGVVIAVLMWPLIKTKKTEHTRKLVSVVSGLCILLLVGVVVDIIFSKTPFHISHFVVWALASIVIYIALPSIEKKHNKAAQVGQPPSSAAS